MKKIFSIFLIALVIALAVSCKKDNKTANSDESTNAPVVTDAQTSKKDIETEIKEPEGITELEKLTISLDGYVIIRGGKNVNATNFQESVLLRSGIEIPIYDSWQADGMTEQKKEILIGDTGRFESSEALKDIRINDYLVSLVGDKIVVVGGSSKSIFKAMQYLSDNCLSLDGKSLSIPKDGYRISDEYMFENLTIDGIPASEFKFYNAGSLTNGREMFDWFSAEVVGADMKTAEKMVEGEHYIILDDTSFKAYEYDIKIEDGNLIVRGSYFTAKHAREHFMTSFLSDISAKSRTYNLTSADNVHVVTDTKDIYTKDQLYKALELVYNDNEKFIVGEEANKLTTAFDTMERFRKYSGKYPALLGNDLGCYGLDLRDIDKSQWSKAICEYVDFASRGGIITFSSHWRNPTGNYKYDWADCRQLLGKEDKWVELLTEGTALNAEFKEQITVDGMFLQALRDNGVPVIWRPMHEMNGSFFWFCIEQGDYVLDAKYFVNMWRYVHDYYTNELGLDNLLWEYGPNISNGNYQDVMYCYVGDDYCDLVSLDWYTKGNYEIEGSGMSYKKLMETGKITNMGEFGLSDNLEADEARYQERVFSAMNLLEDIMLRMVNENGYKMAYLLTWTGRDTIGSMMRAEQFMNSGYIIDLSEMKEIFDSLK